MKSIKLENLLYNLYTIRTYIVSGVGKKGLVLLANNNVSFFITKEEFEAARAPKKKGAQVAIRFHKLPIIDEYLRQTTDRYPVIQTVKPFTSDFFPNFFAFSGGSSRFVPTFVNLVKNLIKTKDHYVVKVGSLTGLIPLKAMLHQVVQLSSVSVRIFLRELANNHTLFDEFKDSLEYQQFKTRLRRLPKDAALIIMDFASLTPGGLKELMVKTYLKAYLLTVNYNVMVYLQSLTWQLKGGVLEEKLKRQRKNKIVTARHPTMELPIDLKLVPREELGLAPVRKALSVFQRKLTSSTGFGLFDKSTNFLSARSAQYTKTEWVQRNLIERQQVSEKAKDGEISISGKSLPSKGVKKRGVRGRSKRSGTRPFGTRR